MEMPLTLAEGGVEAVAKAESIRGELALRILNYGAVSIRTISLPPCGLLKTLS